MNTLRNLFIAVIMVLTITLTIHNIYNSYNKEGFKSLYIYGAYPKQHDDPLLADSYEKNENIVPTRLTQEDLKRYKPRTPIKSYAQVTNNFKYWDTPNNGECKPASFCDAYYKKKVHRVREIEVPLTNNKRVNFFNYTLDKERTI